MTRCSDCDECGRRGQRIVRNYKDRCYCSTCYARCFKHRPCSACGLSARLLVGDENAKCESCVSFGPCVRCGREQFELGRRTRFGPACKPCSVYFRAPRSCEHCGRSSRRLVRGERDGVVLRLCCGCQRANNATCSRCRRYRRILAWNDRRPLCSACASGDLKKCPICACQMPPGRIDRCDPCYRKDLLRRRVVISVAALASNSIAAAFQNYAEWLSNNVGPLRASRLINLHLRFFLEIEKHWLQLPSSFDALEQLGPAQLRRYVLPMRYLASIGKGTLSGPDKAKAADLRRVARALEGVERDGPAHGLLSQYRAALLERHGSGCLTPLSMRLALTAAKGLLLASRHRPSSLPDQSSVDGYIKEKPGQRASLSGFIGHLRRQGLCDIRVPAKPKSGSAQVRATIEDDLRHALSEERCPKDGGRKLLVLALRYFHGLPLSAARRYVNPEAVAQSDDGSWYTLINQKRYWLPAEVASKCVRIPTMPAGDSN